MCKSRGRKARARFDSYENDDKGTKEKPTGGKSNNRATVTARNRYLGGTKWGLWMK